MDRFVLPVKEAGIYSCAAMATRLYYHYGEERPVQADRQTQKRLWLEARSFVLKRFAPGTKTIRDEISEILKCYFSFFALRLESTLKKIASREFMELVLHQYDLAGKKSRALPREETIEVCQQNSWLSSFRRGLKYVAERTAMISPRAELAPAGGPQLFGWVPQYPRILQAITLKRLPVAEGIT